MMKILLELEDPREGFTPIAVAEAIIDHYTHYAECMPADMYANHLENLSEIADHIQTFVKYRLK